MTLRNTKPVLVAIFASVTAAAMAIGGVVPLLSLALDARGHSATVVGANVSVTAVAIMTTGFFLPHALRRFGALRVVTVGMVLGAVFTVLIGVTEALGAWMVLRFLVGLTTASLWIVSEIWVNRLASEKNRGVLLGVYSALFGVGFAIGPSVTGQFHPLSPVPYILVAGALLLTLVPLAVARRVLPAAQADDSLISVSLVRKAPLVFVAAMVSGATEMTTFSLLPLFGLKSGFEREAALLMVSAFALGNVLMQIPIGWLSDRIGRVRMTGACAGAATLAAIFLPWAMEAPVAGWLLLVFWGGVGFGIYTSGLGLLGKLLPPQDLAAGNSLFIICYMSGGLTGPLLGGAATDLIGAPGALIVQALAGAVLVIGAVWAGRKKA